MAITNFIPEVWSAAILEALRAKLVFPSLCNRDYEGDIREAGDTVHITGYDDVTVRKYVRGQAITVDMAPGVDVFARLKAAKSERPRQSLAGALAEIVPKRLAQLLAEPLGSPERLADMPDRLLRAAAESVNAWTVKPVGSEGYRTAEVTLGGVDTGGLESKTMQAKAVPGLYFIGEVVDVTGWLGGYNFQWAWSSGWVAGQSV